MSRYDLVPRKLFFTSGVGRHPDSLASFEMALRDSKIEHLNLVAVSSIVPPGCSIVPKAEGLAELRPGEITFVVLSRISSSDSGRLISASVGCAIPGDESDNDRFGYLAEHHTFDKSKDETRKFACDLAREMYTTLSCNSDIDIRTCGIAADAASGYGCTTVVCAAVFLL